MATAKIMLPGASRISALTPVERLRGIAIASLNRMIPPEKLLPQARGILSPEAVRCAPNSSLRNIGLFLQRLGSVGIASHAQFQTFVIPERGDPVSGLLAQLGCRFAYNASEQLVIGTIAEVEAGTKAGSLSYTRKNLPVAVPSASLPDVPRPAIEPRVITEAIVIDRPETLSRKELRLKEALKQTVTYLLRDDQPELAAVVLFSTTERSLAENIMIVGEIAGEIRSDVFRACEGMSDALKLAQDVEDTKLITPPIDVRTMLLGYLLGEYADAAPYLAGRVLDFIGDPGLLVNIFACMENHEFRASAVQGLSAHGKTRLVNAIVRTGLSGPYALYHDRFRKMVDTLSQRDGELYYDHFTYLERGGKTVYKRKPKVSALPPENSVTADSKAIILYDRARRAQETVSVISPDVHLLQSLKKLLEDGADELAARIAFGGYRDVVARFANLRRLEFLDLGKLLHSLSNEERTEVMVDLMFSLGENTEIGEAAALAVLYPQDEKNLERAGEWYHRLLTAEAGYPGARFAARKLMLIGFCAPLTSDDYGLLYADLENKYPDTYIYDGGQFVRTDGRLAEADAGVGHRKVQLKHYYSILKDDDRPQTDRIMAAGMLGRLGAVEYFSRLAAMMGKTKNPKDEVAGAVFVAVAQVYGGLDAGEERQRTARKSFNQRYFGEKTKEGEKYGNLFIEHGDKLGRLAASAIPLSESTLEHGNNSTRKKAAELLLQIKSTSDEAERSHLLAYIYIGKIQSGWVADLEEGESVFSLGAYGLPAVKKTLLNDWDDSFRHIMAIQLEKAPDEFTTRLIPLFEQALADPFLWARNQAARNLGYLKAVSAVPKLSVMVRKDVSDIVRESAANALGGIGDPSAMEPLSKALLSERKIGARIAIARNLSLVADSSAKLMVRLRLRLALFEEEHGNRYIKENIQIAIEKAGGAK